ncbi:MAG: alanine--tRNA ligase [Clostridia bacterium]|nr:alanine--tRNA ligase [Clostridia bacterium]MDD4375507.1 alanine--tRNA ligase [Clostridia bacterium]
MKAIELRKKYLDFFESKGHTIIPCSPVVPENDPTVLFTTAGMHPLVPYLLGEKHPGGKRLAGYQKCLRTDDIDEVGDTSHLTFFEMLGNWSLGNYFKKEAIEYSFEFLTKELNIPIDKISVSCFAGDEDCPKDVEAYQAWKSLGIPDERIYFFGKDQNWWGPAGKTGPCGPDTEMFIDIGTDKCSKNCDPSCNCGKYIEIWNNVFMQYNKKADGTFEELEQKNVDTGMGLERTAFIMQGKNNVFETEIFAETVAKIKELATEANDESVYIIADHLRAAAFIILDGIVPTNTDQGYVLRRLMRRTIRHMRKINLETSNIELLLEVQKESLMELYPELIENHELIVNEFKKEIQKFEKTLINGEKEFGKISEHLKKQGINKLSGKTIFRLYDTFGFPPEVTEELATENGFDSDIEGFKEFFKAHQKKSRQGAEQKFKGGLADNSEQTIKYHTAAHLLLGALKRILGEHVYQRGSNLTAERLRFDFNHPQKMTDEEKQKVEELVNEQIKRNLKVTMEEMSLEAAKESGADGVFDSKYGTIVKVYSAGDFSKEICGGPHVENTSVLGKFKIKKEEAVSSGVRRIKAILE